MEYDVGKIFVMLAFFVGASVAFKSKGATTFFGLIYITILIEYIVEAFK